MTLFVIILFIVIVASMILANYTKDIDFLRFIQNISVVIAVMFGVLAYQLLAENDNKEEGVKKYLRNPNNFTISYTYTKVNDSLVCTDTIVKLNNK